MKQTHQKKIFNAFLLVLYFAIIYCFNLENIWFSLALVFLSVPSLFSLVTQKLDSKLHQFSLLFYCGIFGILQNYYNLPAKDFYFVYIFIFGLASFSIFVFFRQKFHLKIFVICSCEVLLLIMYKIQYVTILEFILLEIAFLLLISQNLAKRIYVNTRSN